MIRFIPLMCVFAVVFVVAGCDRMLYQETRLSQNRVQVEQEQYTQSVDLRDVNEKFLYALSSHYRAKGDGPFILSVTYDARAFDFTATQATDEVARITRLLRDYGVENLDASILPVAMSDDVGRMMVSYVFYEARPPEDCGRMPGFNDLDASFDEDYKLGCTVEAMIGRQVAHPKDLKEGRKRTKDETDGRVHTNIIEAYRLGGKNSVLEGESSTGDE